MDRLINKIHIYRNSANLYETDITNVVNAMLELAEKTWINGYSVKDEIIMASLGGIVPQFLRLKKADKAIFQDETPIIRISQDRDDKYEIPVLVIECKTETHLHKQGYEKCVRQLAKYVVAGEFPTGMLITEQRAKVFQLNEAGLGMAPRQNLGWDYPELTTDLPELVEFIRGL
ncbi:hypothetical protein CONCODRAFT_83635 [Conidiobolus coronatus NRRL 28638]|uniref:Type I restriction enzyme R protein N-terminal domain-containing protein n=1 Tax=Conidiobolus coronatus (strain ATCC 28846 / CBS 209.66 / NRRL 28638) TaxID=796925 RepID=A0A137PDX9_CONC2|nr:hypothetical protein CONCODRAFT_83635 [Conidiobolus coronatus NRRL 28638]|eukprot:KXN73172.1 hypothetical protein CONCODRAFT_83635 [Conidiobolus coronatus NRRL 28638]